MSENPTPVHPGPGYSYSGGPKAPANVPGGAPQTSEPGVQALPTLEEFVAAGYKAENYETFVKEHQKK